MLHYPGTNVGPIRRFVGDYHPGGLILMGDNIALDLPQEKRLVSALSIEPGLPLITGIDQEGGVVRRIMSDVAPAGWQLRSLPPSASKAAFASRAAILHGLGISVNFGIIADETSNPRSFIYSRILGSTPSASAARVAQAVAGEQGSVFSTLKHFPGHGVAEADSHSSIPTSSISYQHWIDGPAVPFKSGITAGAEFVMFGHLRLSAVDSRPATLSPKWHDILRTTLGFTGIIITDDMLMLQRSGDPRYRDPSKNAIAALAAGNTMLLYVLPANPADVGINLHRLVDDIVAAVLDGRIDRALIDSDAKRILAARRELSGLTSAYVHCGTRCLDSAR
jgi:beta-N-acetylhexosaminidase